MVRMDDIQGGGLNDIRGPGPADVGENVPFTFPFSTVDGYPLFLLVYEHVQIYIISDGGNGAVLHG